MNDYRNSRFGHHRFPVAYCLSSLILLLVAYPFIEDLPGGALIQTVLTTIVLLFALLAMVGRWKRMAFGLLLALPSLFARWENYYQPGPVWSEIFQATAILFFGFVVFEFLGFIFHARRVDSEVLCAAATIYLLLGVIWSIAYSIVDWLVPNSYVFNTGAPIDHSMGGFQALYFSFITLSTIGYGDIVPLSKVARLLVMVESGVGMFYVSLLVARLVSVYSSRDTTGPKREHGS